jgi:hypothetical protein
MGPIGKTGLIVRLQQEAHHFADQLIRPARQSEGPEFSVFLWNEDPFYWAEPVALVTQGIDDASDLAQ